MPDFIEQALASHHLTEVYQARPAYQRNDYIGWITGAAGGHPARAAGADARGAAPGRPVHEDALALTRAPAGQPASAARISASPGPR
jgi:hypothetical protein